MNLLLGAALLSVSLMLAAAGATIVMLVREARQQLVKDRRIAALKLALAEVAPWVDPTDLGTATRRHAVEHLFAVAVAGEDVADLQARVRARRAVSAR